MAFPYYTEPTHDQGVVTPTAGNAARSTATSQAEGRLIVDAVDKIFLLEPNKHPLTSLLSNVGRVYDGKAWTGASMQKAETTNPEFTWFEDVYGGRYATAAGAVLVGATSMDVASAGASPAFIFTVGDVVRNSNTGEQFLVTGITDANTIAIQRGFGSVPAAAMSLNDPLYIVGNANEENAGARNTNTTRASKQTNYTQIFKTTIALTNTEKSSATYGDKDLSYQRAKKGTEHALDIERALWFGQKYFDTTGPQGQPRRTTGGVNEFITTSGAYVQNQGGALTAPDMNTFLREGFTYGNSTKMLFAGGIVLQAVNEMSRGQLQTKVGDTTYGVKISEWQTPFGTVNIVHNPLFTGVDAGSAFLLDLESFRIRNMSGRDTRLLTNVQANDVDGEVDQYVTETGLERKQAPRHAKLTGVTG
jgi:hypothetical protein